MPLPVAAGQRSRLNCQTNPSLERGVVVRISRTAAPGFGVYEKANGLNAVPDNWVLIDTNVLIEVGRGVREAVICLQQIEQQASPAISAISQMELTIGCSSKSELRSLDRFLLRFHIVKLNEQISDTAIVLLHRYR
jgi:hypothetical protein